MGLEPTTLGTTNRCSNQLSYDRHSPSARTRKVLARRARPLRGMSVRCKQSEPPMPLDHPHATLRKFGYPHSLLHEGEHWAVLVRPAQPTLGSLVLCATSEHLSYGDLPAEAFAEQGRLVARIERTLKAFCNHEKLNYLMLMMVDPHIHFHVLPRYSGERQWQGITFPDSGWPGLPDLTRTTTSSKQLIGGMRDEWTAAG